MGQARHVHASKEEIRDLANNIKAHGLTHSIIIADGVVIDGLKRLEAYKALKRDTIPAFVSDNFVELADRLDAAQAGGVTNMPRVIELAQALSVYKDRYTRMRKQYAGAKKHARTYPGYGLTVRQHLSRALGVSEGRVEILMHSIRVAKADPEIKEKLE